jgi:hypothetical protein
VRPLLLLVLAIGCGNDQDSRPKARILAPSNGQQLGSGRVELVAAVSDDDGEMDIASAT